MEQLETVLAPPAEVASVESTVPTASERRPISERLVLYQALSEGRAYQRSLKARAEEAAERGKQALAAANYRALDMDEAPYGS